METLWHGLVEWCSLKWVWVAACMMCAYIRDKGVQRGRLIFPPKCLQRCKRRCEGPWLRLAHLTDWKQGFIFSNLWSQHGERSVKGRRREGVPGETLGGEMKDVGQDKLSSADVDERRPANRDKWDCFDLNLTCCFRKPFSVLHPLFLSLCLTSILCVQYWASPAACLNDRQQDKWKIYWAIYIKKQQQQYSHWFF